MIDHDFASPRAMRTGSLLAASALVASAFVLPTGAAMAQEETTITAVMHSGLRVLDPIITTAHISRDHGYMIYDVLVAQNDQFEPQPQMAEFAVSEDGLVYTFTLREGLLFHDGAPVTAEDAVASLQRWGQRDSGGQLIFDVTESLEASDERTITWRLTEPFGQLLAVISKQSAVPPFIMPARVAATPPTEAITDYVGSGPFVFQEDQFQPGVSVTYEKFDEYAPREEPANWMSGGKVVNVDRVVWQSMPDIQTSINALISGEVDFLETVQIDLLPILQASPDIVAEVRDPLGYQTMARPNFLHPPFDNKAIRQAALRALGQESVLAALVGNPEYYMQCGAIFGCNTPLATDGGSQTLLSGGDPEGARALLEEAGYDGTPIVLMHPTDVVTLAAQPVVVAQQLRAAGFTVDLQPMDWQTLVTRRASQAAPADGGWNMFITNWVVPEINTPLVNAMVNGRGEDAWFGWPTDPVLEDMRGEYIDTDSPEAQLEIATRIQEHVLDEVLYVPLGEYTTVQARRQNIVDILPSPVLVFWNLSKTQ